MPTIHLHLLVNYQFMLKLIQTANSFGGKPESDFLTVNLSPHILKIQSNWPKPDSISAIVAVKGVLHHWEDKGLLKLGHQWRKECALSFEICTFSSEKKGRKGLLWTLKEENLQLLECTCCLPRPHPLLSC